MITKLLYTVISLIKISFSLNNPLVLLNYIFNKPACLNMKKGFMFQTDQVLDALVIKDTVIDDSYLVDNLRLPTKKTIIDIGAGLGDFTIMAAKKFPKAKIIAFDPNPNQFRLLQKNIKLNGVRNIECYKKAVGTKKSYYLYLSSFNIHASIIKNKPKKFIRVQGINLNNFLNNRIDLIKIDCEGAEVDILKSINSKKIKFIRRFIIEYHNKIIKNADQKILTILNKWNYKFKIKKNSLIPETGYVFASKN